MFRPAFRSATVSSLPRAAYRSHAARRFVSTAPPHQKSRSWKSSAARWGLAGALVYYYNTSSVFAEEPAYAVHAPPETSSESETYPTVASISEERRAQSRLQPQSQSDQPASQYTTATAPDDEQVAAGSPEALEEEASEQGAFNEETGEINWDCPCLGGMAYGPCGEQFRAAFSCFVFSKEEPKGVDCIEHFKSMQDCFRQHPDVYGAELDDDDEVAGEGPEGNAVPASTDRESVSEAGQLASMKKDDGAAKLSPTPSTQPGAVQQSVKEPRSASLQSSNRSPLESPQSASSISSDRSEDVSLVPKAWHDAGGDSQRQ